jgi:hypothetical protein
VSGPRTGPGSRLGSSAFKVRAQCGQRAPPAFVPNLFGSVSDEDLTKTDTAQVTSTLG